MDLSIRQILRAALTLAMDAVAMRFANRKAVPYTSAGQETSGAIYYSRGNIRATGVLLLHTASGLTPHEHAMARRLAKEGFTVLVIAYSKRTSGSVLKDKQQRNQIEQIVLRGLRVLQEDPMTDANNIAVIGLSLGGYFATHLAASVEEAPPKCAVVYYGAYDIEESEIASLRAPLLILQGEEDRAEFVKNAKRIKELSVRYERPCELVMYPGAGHQFDLFDPRSKATREAWSKTVEFLNQQLRR